MLVNERKQRVYCVFLCVCVCVCVCVCLCLQSYLVGFLCLFYGFSMVYVTNVFLLSLP